MCLSTVDRHTSVCNLGVIAEVPLCAVIFNIYYNGYVQTYRCLFAWKTTMKVPTSMNVRRRTKIKDTCGIMEVRSLIIVLARYLSDLLVGCI